MSTVDDRVGRVEDAAEPVSAGPPVGGSPAGGVAGLEEELAAALVARARERGDVALTGPDGLLTGLIKTVLERGLEAELADHLGYERRDRSAAGSGNARNGSTRKTVLTEVGPVAVQVPRDRAGTFEPRLIPKGARRLGGLSDMVISLYAGGMTVRDIQHHLARTVGTEISHDTVSKITDTVLEEVKAWQHRPLDELYPIVYVDALVAKVRDGNAVRNKAVHLAVGVDLDGFKHVLGIWVAQAEGAKHWQQVLAELRNRGVRDILIVCCDGLAGLPEAIGTVFGPATTVQTCVVHLIRAALRYASYEDRKRLAGALRPVYTAANMDAAELALLELAESALGRKYPAAVGVWQRAWDQFVPFLEFTPNLRRIIYTTNAIVIWRPLELVRHVGDEALRSPDLPAGRGYLPSSSRRVPGRFDVRSAGGGARLAA